MLPNQTKPNRLPAERVYLIGSGGFSFFTTLIFTLNLVYHVKTIGLDPLQLVLVGTVLESSAFLFEIPTGVLADFYSRRLSTIIGFFVIGIGFLIEGLFPFFGTLLLAQVVWGLGYTFISGAFDAWITDEVGSEAVGAVFIRSGQIQQVCNFIAIPFCIFLGNIALNLPIIVGAAMFLLMGAWLCRVMPEDHFSPVPQRVHEGFPALWLSFLEGVRGLRGNRAVLQFMGVMLFVGLASEAYDRMNTAHLLTNFDFPQPFSLIITDETWFGILGLLSTASTLLISEQIRKRLDLTHHRRVIGLLILVSGITAFSILLFALTSDIRVAIFAFLLVTVSRNIAPPIQNAWVNQHIEAEYRATTLSMSSQVNAAGQVVGGPVLGWIGKQFSIIIALAISGVLHVGPIFFFGHSYADTVLSEPSMEEN